MTVATANAAVTAPAAAINTAGPSTGNPDASDVFAAVFTAAMTDQDQDPTQERPDPTPTDNVPPAPRIDTPTATPQQDPPSADARPTSHAELTQSRALLNLTPQKTPSGAAESASPETPTTAVEDAEPASASAAPSNGTLPAGAAQQGTPATAEKTAEVAPVEPRHVATHQQAAASGGENAASVLGVSADQRPPAASLGDEADDDDTDDGKPTLERTPHTPLSAHHITEQPPTLTPAVTPHVTPDAPRPEPAEDAPAAPAATTAATAVPAADTTADSSPLVTLPTVHQPAPVTSTAAVASAAPVSAPSRTVPADVAAAVRQQLTGPLVKISHTDGEQVLVVQVRPENLGPVTVHAHVRDNSVHVELFAPSDVGRDALTQVSADLRADLQAAHTGNTSLNVSSQTAPSADKEGKPRDGSSAEPRTGERHSNGDTPGQDAQQHQPRGSNRLLDVLA